MILSGSDSDKRHGTINKILSFLMVAAGGILMSLPLTLWDFLVYEQFKPAARPLYPLFYSAIFLGGAAVAVLGFLGFFRKSRIGPDRSGIFGNFLLPVFSILVGAGVLIGTFDLYRTTEYLAADKLYIMILAAPVLGSILFLLFIPSGILVIIGTVRKTGTALAARRANLSSLIVVLAGAAVACVVMLPPDAEAKPFPEDLPFKTVLYAQGDAGYNTFKIPTMVTAPNGTILSFAEARSEHKDDWSKTDVVVRKSYDKGTTWTPLEVLLEDNNSIIGNACPVVDESTGIIWLIFCRQNDRAFKIYSEDNGESWSIPVEITGDVKLAGWTWYATGPSHGVQLADGTLVIPADHIENRRMKAHVIFSKDHGRTWQLGGTVPGGEEATLVQLDNGDLYVNIRPVAPGYRVTARSTDQGITWQDVTQDPTLPDPACQGSMIKIERADGSLYLFTNPADTLHREKMTLRLSSDECRTWSKARVLYDGLSAYSALSLIDAENLMVGCIFENGANFYSEQIVFVRFPIDYISN